MNCGNENKSLGLNIVKENTKADISVAAKMSCGFSGFSGVGIFGNGYMR
ncbi:MAG: hypothetical protein V1682_02180 [Candidatus Omnitrophota bacterium]